MIPENVLGIKEKCHRICSNLCELSGAINKKKIIAIKRNLATVKLSDRKCLLYPFKNLALASDQSSCK